jgi:hypothetical protein
MLGDPDKKQQNEPSCDINPTNPLIVFCGMNDYRAVDRPDIIGEPFVGASFSMDGGLTWKSHLHPGFKPQATNAPTPLVPPLGYDTGADPIVRIAPGIALFNFIAFDRGGTGALLVSRWYERSLEGGFPYGYLETVEIAKGTGSPGDSGRFIDKPVMKISLNPGTSTYNLAVPDPAQPGGTRIQKVPAGVVHVAYAVFTGNSEQDGTKIVYNRSTDYGKTWQPGTELLSETVKINQAPDIAADAATNRVVVVWRRFATPNLGQTDGIMYAVSTNNGLSFSKPAQLAEICAFTQNTTSTSFRTTTHPFVTFDGTAFHAVWAARQGACATGPSRIVMSSLSAQGTWSSPQVVDTTASSSVGHQFQPSIATSGPRILVSWFDTRNDPRAFDPTPDPYVDDYVFGVDPNRKVRRRSADIYAAQADTGQTPLFGPPKQVSRYLFGVYPDRPAQTLERNNVNNRMFQSGRTPFMGDYPASAGVNWVLKDPIGSPGEWVSSAGKAGVQPVFHLAWTDNRLVRSNVSGNPNDPNSTTPYTPPPLSAQSEPDPTTVRGACTVQTASTRDQTVFAARIYPDLILVSPSTSKPTGSTVRRAYALYVQNTRPADRSVANGTPLRLLISGVSPGFTASFRETGPDLLELDPVEVAARSSAARTVFVTAPPNSPAARPVVKIDAYSSGQLVATTYINGNSNAAPLEDALDETDSIPNESIGQVELHTPDILYRSTAIGTPAIDDPAIDDPAIDDPAIDDPAIDDPAIDDPAIDDPAIDDPAIDDPAIDDPAIDDPAIDDPAIDDAAVPSSSIQDPDAAHPGNTVEKLTQITWKVKLDGNATTSMSTKVFVNADQGVLNALNGAKRQLIVSRRYTSNDIRSGAQPCVSVRVSSYQVIANVVDPVLTNDPSPPDQVNPPLNEPSATIPPGSAIYLTFRLWGEVPGFAPNRVGVVVASQPENPEGFPPAEESNLPPVIETTVLPRGTVGVQYARTLVASGGTTPFTWSLDSGSLPAGLSLDASTGVISGTPTTVEGPEFVVRVTDDFGLFDTRTLCIHIAEAPPTSITVQTLNPSGQPTLEQLVNTLLGPGVTVSNISITGANAAAGTFDGATSAVGFASGILLSTGQVSDMTPTNTADTMSQVPLGTAGDAQLTVLAGQPTHDAAVIEFDFVPSSNRIKFEYVFASDEYNEFANQIYNDVFAFFVNGVNYARLPNSNITVAINNVNGGNPFGTNAQNPSFYRNNDPNDPGPAVIPTQADGLTVVLTFEAPVNQGATNHIKLAIADAFDGIYDSWVFIKGGSFKPVENCTNGVDDDADGRIDMLDPDCSCQQDHEEGGLQNVLSHPPIGVGLHAQAGLARDEPRRVAADRIGGRLVSSARFTRAALSVRRADDRGYDNRPSRERPVRGLH